MSDVNHGAEGPVSGAQPGPGAEAISPLDKAKGTLKVGVVLTIFGVVLSVVTYLAMAFLGSNETFPFARVLGFLVLLLGVVALVCVVRGLMMLVTGARDLVRAPK